jgi:serine/threonine protein kinase
VPARKLRQDGWSEAWECPARDDLDFPLMLERTRAHLLGDPVLPLARAQVQMLAGLPSPFRPIVEVRMVDGLLEVVQQRFLGVVGSQLLIALRNSRRVLPLDVWLSIAATLCNAWEVLLLDGLVSRLMPSPERFGVEVRRRLLVFPDADQSVSEELMIEQPLVESLWPTRDYASPELLANAAHAPRSRVFSLAVALVELLTGTHPMRRSTRWDTAAAITNGEARWEPNDHPACTPAIAAVLSAAMDSDPAGRPASPRMLLEKLIAAARIEPASAARVGDVVLGAAPERWRVHLGPLKDDPALLPVVWRNGGLAVLEDQLLETMTPLDRLEKSRAPERVLPPPRQRTPRLNLAPTTRPSWWQGLWPFKR